MKNEQYCHIYGEANKSLMDQTKQLLRWSLLSNEKCFDICDHNDRIQIDWEKSYSFFVTIHPPGKKGEK